MADQQLVPSVAVEKFDLIKPKLPKPVQEGYEWHNEDNRRQAVEGAEALWLALRYNVQPQVFIYQEKLLDLYHKDQADCVHDVIQRETGYNGFVYQSTKKPTTKFRQQLEKEWDSTKGYSGEWVNRWFEYERLDTYAKPIPIHALRVLSLLERYNITPDMLWVATFKSIIPRPKLDPLFVVSFDRWFVAMAEWV